MPRSQTFDEGEDDDDVFVNEAASPSASAAPSTDSQQIHPSTNTTYASLSQKAPLADKEVIYYLYFMENITILN